MSIYYLSVVYLTCKFGFFTLPYERLNLQRGLSRPSTDQRNEYCACIWRVGTDSSSGLASAEGPWFAR